MSHATTQVAAVMILAATFLPILPILREALTGTRFIIIRPSIGEEMWSQRWERLLLSFVSQRPVRWCLELSSPGRLQEPELHNKDPAATASNTNRAPRGAVFFLYLKIWLLKAFLYNARVIKDT